MQMRINGIADAIRESLTQFLEILDDVASRDSGRLSAVKQKNAVRLEISTDSAVFSTIIHTTEIICAMLAFTKEM